MDIAVGEDQLSQAIGRGGQNVRLASELCGWELNVMTAQEAEEKSEAEAEEIIRRFVDKLDVDEEVAGVLVDEGFASIEEIAFVPTGELTQIEGFDEEVVESLRGRAREVLLQEEQEAADAGQGSGPADDLVTMEGMDQATADAMAAREIVTMDDLAEQSVDELLELEGMTQERAAALIMKAREPWFAESGTAEQTS